MKSRCSVVATIALAGVLLAGCAAQAPAPVRHTTPPPQSAAPGTVQRMHVVQPGDTLLGIARQYGQNLDDLIVWNGLMDPNQLRVGQEIRVSPSVLPGAGTAVAIAQPVEIQPIVPSTGMRDARVVYDPRGGTQPYSDQAWAAIRPDAGVAPSSAVPPPAQAIADSRWLWPATGQLIAGFNEATNKGVDIAGNPGDPVIASAAGQVVYSGSGLRGYGKLVIIKHDDEYLTAYAHNQTLLVKEGDAISKGQRIAELGSTDADRPKLHFEIRRLGRPVDPMQYLPPR
ncbi:peptidoglycan DD-metalloendopeptidase family protein [Rhodocyclaceae bacterium SMB388]